jgi:hypothetical protein
LPFSSAAASVFASGTTLAFSSWAQMGCKITISSVHAAAVATIQINLLPSMPNISRGKFPGIYNHCRLGRDLEANEERKQRDTFDESRGDNHRRLDTASDFGLAGHALQGAGSELADAKTGANDDQSGTDMARIEDTPARLCHRRCGDGKRHQQST